jgi:glycine dehydrogenase subunit 2
VSRKADGTYHLDVDRPKSIGRVRSFFGNTGVLFRAYCYIRSQGPDGLNAVAQNAVLNANYLRELVKHVFPAYYSGLCMHEFVASARSLMKERGVRAMDIAKRLLDYGFHAPTVYFPLIVPEALMIEPTETENRETIEAFAQTLIKIAGEDPSVLHDAPSTTPISRPDEVRAAKSPILKWTP